MYGWFEKVEHGQMVFCHGSFIPPHLEPFCVGGLFRQGRTRILSPGGLILSTFSSEKERPRMCGILRVGATPLTSA